VQDSEGGTAHWAGTVHTFQGRTYSLYMGGRDDEVITMHWTVSASTTIRP